MGTIQRLDQRAHKYVAAAKGKLPELVSSTGCLSETLTFEAKEQLFPGGFVPRSALGLDLDSANIEDHYGVGHLYYYNNPMVRVGKKWLVMLWRQEQLSPTVTLVFKHVTCIAALIGTFWCADPPQ